MRLGWSTNFSAPDLNDQGVQTTAAGARGGHQPSGGDPDSIAILPTDYLGLDVLAPLTAPACGRLPSRKLGTVTAGELFHDGVGLEEVRQRLAGHPHDVWLYQMAAGWTRIGQEEHLMGGGGPGGRRPGLAGDRRPTGPRSDAAVLSHGAPVRPVREVVRHCFQQAEGRPWPAAAPQPGARRHILAGTRPEPGRGLRGLWPACTTAWA